MEYIIHILLDEEQRWKGEKMNELKRLETALPP
jgi:hypothetical protein